MNDCRTCDGVFFARVGGQAILAAEESGLSRREIAKRMGLRSPSTIQRLLGGDPKNVTLSTLVRFAAACGTSLDVRIGKPNITGFDSGVQ